MLATLINTVAIIVCAILGNFLQKGFPDSLRILVMQLLGLVTSVIGIRMAMKAENDLVIVIALVLGAVVGHACRLDYHLNQLGAKLKKLVRVQDSNFVDGFVSASLIFCVGAMAIVGSFEAGLHHNYSIILTKSALDGIMSIVLASTLGIGVAFSALTVLAYQGLLTLLAGWLLPILTESVIASMSACGGILIFAIGLGVAGIKEINTINVLPSLLFVALITGFMPV